MLSVNLHQFLSFLLHTVLGGMICYQNSMHTSNAVTDILPHTTNSQYHWPVTAFLYYSDLCLSLLSFWLPAIWPFQFSLACLVECLGNEIKVAEKSNQSIKSKPHDHSEIRLACINSIIQVFVNTSVKMDKSENVLWIMFKDSTNYRITNILPWKIVSWLRVSLPLWFWLR